MIKVGITGGIGAGKSLVCKIFKLYQIPVYDADYFAKHLMQTDADLINNIKSTFGENIYDSKILNRKKLAAIVFNDAEKLDQLNQLVHPAVQQHSLKWMQNQQNAPYALKEAALLFETGSYKSLDLNIVVTAPEALRIKRVIKRDNTDEASIKKRMSKQWPDDKKLALARFTIHNNETEPLLLQVQTIHQQILIHKKTTEI